MRFTKLIKETEPTIETVPLTSTDNRNIVDSYAIGLSPSKTRHKYKIDKEFVKHTYRNCRDIDRMCLRLMRGEIVSGVTSSGETYYNNIPTSLNELKELGWYYSTRDYEFEPGEVYDAQTMNDLKSDFDYTIDKVVSWSNGIGDADFEFYRLNI